MNQDLVRTIRQMASTIQDQTEWLESFSKRIKEGSPEADAVLSAVSNAVTKNGDYVEAWDELAAKLKDLPEAEISEDEETEDPLMFATFKHASTGRVRKVGMYNLRNFDSRKYMRVEKTQTR